MPTNQLKPTLVDGDRLQWLVETSASLPINADAVFEHDNSDTYTACSRAATLGFGVGVGRWFDMEGVSSGVGRDCLLSGASACYSVLLCQVCWCLQYGYGTGSASRYPRGALGKRKHLWVSLMLCFAFFYPVISTSLRHGYTRVWVWSTVSSIVRIGMGGGMSISGIFTPGGRIDRTSSVGQAFMIFTSHLSF